MTFLLSPSPPRKLKSLTHRPYLVKNPICLPLLPPLSKQPTNSLACCYYCYLLLLLNYIKCNRHSPNFRILPLGSLIIYYFKLYVLTHKIQSFLWYHPSCRICNNSNSHMCTMLSFF